MLTDPDSYGNVIPTKINGSETRTKGICEFPFVITLLLVGPGNHNDVSEFPLIPHNGRRHRLMREFPDAISSN